jgi:hypothetical protein
MKDPYKVEEALDMILITLVGVSVIGLLVATVGVMVSAFNL